MGRARCANGTDSHRVREEVVASSKERANKQQGTGEKEEIRECPQRMCPEGGTES